MNKTYSPEEVEKRGRYKFFFEYRGWNIFKKNSDISGAYEQFVANDKMNDDVIKADSFESIKDKIDKYSDKRKR
jgi:hypothetical protein